MISRFRVFLPRNSVVRYVGAPGFVFSCLTRFRVCFAPNHRRPLSWRTGVVFFMHGPNLGPFAWGTHDGSFYVCFLHALVVGRLACLTQVFEAVRSPYPWTRGMFLARLARRLPFPRRALPSTVLPSHSLQVFEHLLARLCLPLPVMFVSWPGLCTFSKICSRRIWAEVICSRDVSPSGHGRSMDSSRFSFSMQGDEGNAFVSNGRPRSRALRP